MLPFSVLELRLVHPSSAASSEYILFIFRGMVMHPQVELGFCNAQTLLVYKRIDMG